MVFSFSLQSNLNSTMRARGQKLKVALRQNLVLALIETMARTGRTLANPDGVDANFVYRTDFVVNFWGF